MRLDQRESLPRKDIETNAGDRAGHAEEAIVVRRIVEEDVTTPSTTVVDDDGSWIGRTIVALVVITLLVIGAIWLVRAVTDDTGGGVGDPDVNITQNDGGDTSNTDQNNTDTSNTDTSPAPVPS